MNELFINLSRILGLVWVVFLVPSLGHSTVPKWYCNTTETPGIPQLEGFSIPKSTLSNLPFLNATIRGAHNAEISGTSQQIGIGAVPKLKKWVTHLLDRGVRVIEIDLSLVSTSGGMQLVVKHGAKWLGQQKDVDSVLDAFREWAIANEQEGFSPVVLHFDTTGADSRYIFGHGQVAHCWEHGCSDAFAKLAGKVKSKLGRWLIGPMSTGSGKHVALGTWSTEKKYKSFNETQPNIQVGATLVELKNKIILRDTKAPEKIDLMLGKSGLQDYIKLFLSVDDEKDFKSGKVYGLHKWTTASQSVNLLHFAPTMPKSKEPFLKAGYMLRVFPHWAMITSGNYNSIEAMKLGYQIIGLNQQTPDRNLKWDALYWNCSQARDGDKFVPELVGYLPWACTFSNGKGSKGCEPSKTLVEFFKRIPPIDANWLKLSYLSASLGATLTRTKKLHDSIMTELKIPSADLKMACEAGSWCMFRRVYGPWDYLKELPSGEREPWVGTWVDGACACKKRPEED